MISKDSWVLYEITKIRAEDPIQYELIIILRSMINHKNISETHYKHPPWGSNPRPQG